MTKGKIITVSVSVELTEDTEKDLHTELTGLANEAMCALLATIPESESRAVGWQVGSLENIGIHKNQRRRFRRRMTESPEPEQETRTRHLSGERKHGFIQTLASLAYDTALCAECGLPRDSMVHEAANDKPH